MQEKHTDEKALLDDYINARSTGPDKLCVEHAFNEFAKEATADNTAVDLTGVKERIWSEIETNSPSHFRLFHHRYRYALAVACSVVIALGVWLIYPQQTPLISGRGENLNGNKILPGHNAATLTLANGEIIELSNAKNGALEEEKGIAILKDKSGRLVYRIIDDQIQQHELNTLSTAKGETYQLQLSDGSNVWLNAQSTLTFTGGLIERGNRVVELQGEAYFEVKKDPEHPFIVKTKDQTVRVLGTKFNINNYPADPFQSTTLLEGAVKIKNNTAEMQLYPGQQVLNDGKSLKIKAVDVSEAIAWKDGYFRFNQLKMAEVAKMLERWYDVNIDLDASLAERQLTGKISRQRDILDILRLIQETNNVKFEIKERRIRIIAE